MRTCNGSQVLWSWLWFTHVSTIADFIINNLYLTTSCSWLCTVGSTLHLHATCASTHAGEWHRLWSERQRTIEAMFWGVSIRVSLLFRQKWMVWCLLVWNSMFTNYPCSVIIPFILKKTQIPNHLATQKQYQVAFMRFWRLQRFLKGWRYQAYKEWVCLCSSPTGFGMKRSKHLNKSIRCN